MRARGYAIASEFKTKGVHAVLGPVFALSRTVGGGTNFEGFGNDLYLIGAAGYETVIGHQAAGVQAEPSNSWDTMVSSTITHIIPATSTTKLCLRLRYGHMQRL